MGEERRGFARVPEPFQATYRTNPYERWKELQTIDVSATGMYAASRIAIDPQTPIELQFKLPLSSGEILFELKGIVLSSQGGPGLTKVRIQFDDVAPDQQAMIDECVQFLLKHPRPHEEG